MKKIAFVLALFAMLTATGMARAQGWTRVVVRPCGFYHACPMVVAPVRPVLLPERRVVEWRWARLHCLRRGHLLWDGRYEGGR